MQVQSGPVSGVSHAEVCGPCSHMHCSFLPCVSQGSTWSWCVGAVVLTKPHACACARAAGDVWAGQG
jgi:hypothetical protein